MKAVDTNVLARLLLQDDAEQAAIAADIIAAGVVVPQTVLLELGWLLGSRMKMDRQTVTHVLTDLIDLPGIHVGDPHAIQAALALYAAGADLADMMHLVASRGAEAFATFDKGVRTSPDLGMAVEYLHQV